MVTTCGLFIFDSTGKILICQPLGIKGRDGWSIPKGKKEKDESELEAALRECLEETGMDFNYTKKSIIELGTAKYKHKKKKLSAFVVHLNFKLSIDMLQCAVKPDEKQPEIVDFEMVDPKEALKRIHNTQSKLLEKYLEDYNDGKRKK
jgi:8-oxo-dGTP pyrophosphatase MutT (NUDIX family)